MAADILGQAWNISQKGEEIISENNTVKDKSTILKNALNSDLKEIGTPVLHKVQNKNNVSQVVLQIQKIRNVAAPKANENSHVAPRMLKLVLTDGDSYIQAIEVTSVPSLHLDKTPPGSKILLHSAKISSGYVLLEPNNCSLLGGKVPALFEKWELAKSVQYHNRQNTSSDGPPAWVNFGCKIQSDMQDKSFKSLDNKNPESKENSKFDLQRQDAIAEATSGAVKKVFGGGAKLPVQPPPMRNRPDFSNRDKRNKSKFGVKELDEKPQKPSERVSLFDFLEDKLPPNDPSNGNVTQLEPAKYMNEGRERSNKNRNYHNVKSEQSYYNVKPQQNYYNAKPGENYYNVKPEQNYYNAKPGENYYNAKPGENYYNAKPGENYYNVKPEPNYYNAKPEPNYYNVKPEQNKIKNEVKPQASFNKIEENVNGLSNNFDKMSLNTQFASRSLRQHLNLGPQKKIVEDASNVISWKIGDDCFAKYWEDGKFYNACITAITDKTCVVKFKGYGNIEEVLKSDCLPVLSKENNKRPHYTGPTEFRRSARTYRRQ